MACEGVSLGIAGVHPAFEFGEGAVVQFTAGGHGAIGHAGVPFTGEGRAFDLVVGFQGETSGGIATAMAAGTVLAHHICDISLISNGRGIRTRAGGRGLLRPVFFTLQKEK